MPKLPTPSAREVIRALSSQGFQVVSQKGSHIKLKTYGHQSKIYIMLSYKFVLLTFRVLKLENSISLNRSKESGYSEKENK